jgi:pimeloyl-ACP methyl ester carboxylesterase
MIGALLLVATLISAGALVCVLAIGLMARAILCPPRMNDGKAMYLLNRLSPGDLGLVFENENFRVRDPRTGNAMNLTGWWIPHPQAAGRCAVLIHGYADAKVGAIAWAPLLHQLGWNVLAIDLRAHGESDGRFSTGGCFEQHDVSQVIDELLVSRPAETKRLLLFGVSLGAAVASAVAASRDDIIAVILESPFPDYAKAVTAHFKLRGLPDGALLRSSIWLAQLISSAKFDSVRIADTVPTSRCPVLAIVGGDDELLSGDDMLALREALKHQHLLIVPNAPHLMSQQVDPVEYQVHLSKFLEGALTGSRRSLSAEDQEDMPGDSGMESLPTLYRPQQNHDQTRNHAEHNPP